MGFIIHQLLELLLQMESGVIGVLRREAHNLETKLLKEVRHVTEVHNVMDA